MARVVSLADRRKPSPKQVDPNLHVEAGATAGRVGLKFAFPDGTTAIAYLSPEAALDIAEIIEEAANDARGHAGKKDGPR
jgi:hypothetical protein